MAVRRKKGVANNHLPPRSYPDSPKWPAAHLGRGGAQAAGPGVHKPAQQWDYDFNALSHIHSSRQLFNPQLTQNEFYQLTKNLGETMSDMSVKLAYFDNYFSRPIHRLHLLKSESV